MGADETLWKKYDSCELIRGCAPQIPLLVDQGAADPFLEEQLQPQRLVAACEEVSFPLTYREHAEYDHSYYFIASLIDHHLRFHAKYLA